MRLGISIAVLSLLAIYSPSISAQTLSFDDCLISSGAQQIDAQCATLLRPEDPERPNGKTIDLSVIKLASHSSEPATDAFTIIQGGPGGSSIDLAVMYSGILDNIRSKRDILVIDQRGTGRSQILKCPLPPEETQLVVFDPALIRQQSKDCVASIDQDLRFYTTSVAVQDLDALRIAAGYSKLTVYGVSYGTRVALHYLRRFPEKSRAIVLDGVVDVGLNLAGGEIARRSQSAFDMLAERCSADESCRASFGDLKAKLAILLVTMEDQEYSVSLPDPVSGALTDKQVTKNDLLAILRLMAYSTEGSSLLPLVIAEAHDGNFAPLAAQSLMMGSDFFENYAVAMNNSVVCAEDAPYVENDDVQNLQDTYFGNSMAEAMRITCEEWPRGVMDSDFRTPFKSDVPVLILSGETDPITPPENGARAATMLENSKHIIVPAHGHGVMSRGCVTQLVLNFVQDSELSALNDSCVERERAMPFMLNTVGPKP